MIEVLPGIIPESYRDLEEKVSEVVHLVDKVQMDVVDGIFAPRKSWPYSFLDDPDFKRVTTEEEGLPHWKDVSYELDMLVRNPEEKIEEWMRAGISSIVLHIESTDRLSEAIEKGRYYDLSVGLALNPSTPSELVEEWMEDIDFVQFMGNDKVGYNGVELDRKVLKKIAAFRELYPDATLAIDIGVNVDTAPDLVDAGVTKIVSGSAIFESADIEGTIEYLSNL